MSSDNDFQRREFPFLWISELFPCLSRSSSRLTRTQRLSQEDPLRRNLSTSPKKALHNSLLSNKTSAYNFSALSTQQTPFLSCLERPLPSNGSCLSELLPSNYSTCICISSCLCLAPVVYVTVYSVLSAITSIQTLLLALIKVSVIL
jgi:hypothetical protein